MGFTRVLRRDAAGSGLDAGRCASTDLRPEFALVFVHLIVCLFDLCTTARMPGSHLPSPRLEAPRPPRYRDLAIGGEEFEVRSNEQGTMSR